jgi:hypothetical protein
VARTLAWLAGALGVAGLAKALRRRPQPALEAGPDPRADELRRRLEESKPLVDEPGDDGETTVDQAPDPTRARENVHAKARAAIDEMNRPREP